MFGFCYILPSDSQHYSHESFAVIQEKLSSSDTGKDYVIMGDMNARLGTSVRDV